MHRLALKCFGVGDGWPGADRNHSSFLYRFGKTHFLVDCGEPVSRAFKATGLDYNAIDRVLLSHLHFDHLGGFFMLMQGFWLEHRERDLPVHLPAEGITPIRHLLNAGCIFQELLAFQLRFEPLHAGEPIVTDRVRVTPYPTTHLAGLRAAFQKKYPQAFAAFCFLFETDGLRVAHSGDLGAVEDLEPLVREPLDLLVCELAHFTPESLFHYLQGRSIKRLLFIHLARPLWENLEAIRKQAVQALPHIHVAFAHDGQEFAL